MTPRLRVDRTQASASLAASNMPDYRHRHEAGGCLLQTKFRTLASSGVLDRCLACLVVARRGLLATFLLPLSTTFSGAVCRVGTMTVTDEADFCRALDTGALYGNNSLVAIGDTSSFVANAATGDGGTASEHFAEYV